MAGLLNTHFEFWQQLDSFAGLPDGFLEFIRASSDFDYGDEEFVRTFDNTVKVFTKYQIAYLTMTMGASREMLQILQETQSAETTLNELISTGITVFEKHATEFFKCSDYPQLYADIVNNWMLMIQQIERFILPWQNIMNVPSRDTHAD